MSEEMTMALRNGRGSMKALAPRNYRGDDGVHYGGNTPQYGTWDADYFKDSTRGYQRVGAVGDKRSVLRARARLVRNGIRSVGEACMLRPPDAVGALAREMGTSPARVVAWAERGIQRKWVWEAWCKAVDALMLPADENVDMEKRQQLGAALLRWRLRADLSTRQAAEVCGVAPASYNNWEHGVSAPQPGHRARLWELLAEDPWDENESER